MQIKTVSIKCPTKAKIEDAYSIQSSKRIFGVFDGVTPLVPAENKELDNGGRKASQLLKKHFERDEMTNDLSYELCKANESLRAEMISSDVDLHEKHLLWSTCAVVAYIEDTHMKYAQLGDCMAMAMDDKGNIQVLTVNQVEGIHSRAKKKRAADRVKGYYVPEERFFAERYLAESYSRWLANAADGYGVVNGDPLMKDYIQSGSLALKGIRYVLLISDGMFDLEDNLEDVMRQVVKLGLETYAKRLAAIEIKRGLHSDDKTGILIEFE